ncbi:hypothetical protein HDA30_001783 [Micrococcus cohnii]|uniref:Uncharacterized protein n=2 Tax=Micrococcus TaxID=1269 RepID=A0A7W7M433_9MICC|nr:hypothetical protein [Micrococcus cohnii]MBB4736275.1 hypothetical protein [Micrococcus cohnii]
MPQSRHSRIQRAATWAAAGIALVSLTGCGQIESEVRGAVSSATNEAAASLKPVTDQVVEMPTSADKDSPGTLEAQTRYMLLAPRGQQDKMNAEACTLEGSDAAVEKRSGQEWNFPYEGTTYFSFGAVEPASGTPAALTCENSDTTVIAIPEKTLKDAMDST